MKKTYLSNYLSILVLIGFGVGSCQFEESPTIVQDAPASGQADTEMLVLGKKLENPYSVENMRKAYSNLSMNGRIEELDIRTTDLYVRFLPKDSLQVATLLADTTLILWDYPLDFEVTQIGHNYHDPSIPDSLPTYQYTVVKPDYSFPTVPYEILAELFIPEEYVPSQGSESSRKSLSFLKKLEQEAFRLTGNLEGEDSYFADDTYARKWRPSGKVTVEEALFFKSTGKFLPVVNVKVKAKRWFKLSSTYTDTQGRYTLEEFGGKVDYQIEFESDRVKITDLLGWSRNYNGPNNRESGWDPIFLYWRESWANATVLNAAYECRVQVNKNNLQTPFPTSFWAGSGNAFNKLNIRIKYDEGTGRMVSKPWSINEIKIWTDFSDGRQKGTDYLYRVTFHELGHSMHARLGGSLAFTSKIIRESWADFIEHLFIVAYYPEQKEESGKQDEDKLDWDKGYTPLFIDLIDSENQYLTRSVGDGLDRPNDRVQGYTPIQLQESLVRNNNLREVRDYLKNTYSNPTEQYLDELFDYYLKLE
jgi:hypothetical protein